MRTGPFSGSAPDTDPTAAQTPPPPEELSHVGAYRLLAKLGEGGFGEVWAAEQSEPVRRRVALKLIKLGMDSRAVVARFKAERQALALMDHPGVARVFDGGVVPPGMPGAGRAFFAMELVRGAPINEFVARENLPIEARIRLMQQVCEAVQHAHMKGVIHRDLKPSNILVELVDKRPHVKVIDFGVAKALSNPLTDATLHTQAGAMVGTPEYMSPEQARGSSDIDTRTDVYSLGVVLYEVLTGLPPFERKAFRTGDMETLRRVIELSDPPKPSTRLSSSIGESENGETASRRIIARHLRGDLDWVVMKCLAKERDRRYDTPAALAADLQRHLDNKPVEAGPPAASYRIAKFVRRNRAAVIAGSLVAVALLMGVVGTSYGLVVAAAANEELRSANVELESANQRLDAALARAGVERDRAVEAEQRAQRELARATEVQTFLTSMLSAIEPSTALGKDTELLRTILDDAADRIEAGEIEDPVIEAELRKTVGSTLAAIGLYEEADPMLRRALEIREAELGGDDEKTIDSLGDLSSLLLARGRLEEGEPMVREALKRAEETFGPDDERTLRATHRLGSLLMAQGRYEEAERRLRAALEGQRKLLGESEPQTLRTMNGLGLLLDIQGRPGEAEVYLREAMRGFRNEKGDEHPMTLSAINNVGAALQSQGKLAEAEPFLRESLESSRVTFGEGHPDTLRAAHNLGDLLKQQGKLRDAQPFLMEAMNGARATLGNDHPETMKAVSAVADLLRRQGRLAEAEPLVRGTLEWFRRERGDLHPDTLKTVNDMGALLDQQGKLAEAEPFYREALAGARAQLGEDHPSSLRALRNLAGVLRQQGKLEEAEALYREALDGFRRAFGDSHPDTLGLLNDVGVVLDQQGRTEEAMRYYQDALRGFRRTLGDEHPSTLQALNNMAYLLQGQERLSEAAQYFRDALAGYRAAFGEVHPNTLVVMSNLSRLLVDLGEHEEALRLAEECVAGARTSLPNHWLLDNFLGKQGAALTALARYDEAEKILLDAHKRLVNALGENHEQTKRIVEALRDLYLAWSETSPNAGHDQAAAEWAERLASGGD